MLPWTPINQVPCYVEAGCLNHPKNIKNIILLNFTYRKLMTDLMTGLRSGIIYCMIAWMLNHNRSLQNNEKKTISFN